MNHNLASSIAVKLYFLNHRKHSKSIHKFAAFQYFQKYLQVFQGTFAQCVA